MIFLIRPPPPYSSEQFLFFLNSYFKNSQTSILGFGNFKIEKKMHGKSNIQNLPIKKNFIVKVSFFLKFYTPFITYDQLLIKKFDF